MDASCGRTTLAKSGNVQVERCSCGQINLHLGSMSLRLDQDTVERLTSTLAVAMIRNRQLQHEHEAQQHVDKQPTLSLVPDLAESGTA